jgi:hypothetical protein
MPLKTVEEGQKYIHEVKKHLFELRHLSIEAGLNTHAAMWCVITGAFCDSIDEVKTITDMLGMYLEARMAKIEREELEKFQSKE